METKYTLYFDGCSKGNPGKAGIGAVIYKNNDEFLGLSEYIGERQTNNEAEYIALIKGLKKANENKITNISIKGDSLLVINQVLGIWKTNKTELQKLKDLVIQELSNFKHYDFEHIKREFNSRADELANLMLNEEIKFMKDIKHEDLHKDYYEEDDYKYF